jgi:hypothetical protein
MRNATGMARIDNVFLRIKFTCFNPGSNFLPVLLYHREIFDAAGVTPSTKQYFISYPFGTTTLNSQFPGPGRRGELVNDRRMMAFINHDIQLPDGSSWHTGDESSIPAFGEPEEEIN